MPHKTTPSIPAKRPHRTTTTKIERARQILSSSGVLREDSDDELGYDDHPWEWIHERAKNGKLELVGARTGKFKCMLGDAVLLKAEGVGEAWIGLICSFQEEEDEDGEVKMEANFMWFSTEREITNKKKKRTDALPLEVYITPSWDVNPLHSINGKANIVSLETFQKRYPSGKVARSDAGFGKTFICRRGCNTRTATYTDEFVWEDVYRGIEDLLALTDRVQTQTKATRKRHRDSGYHEELSDDLNALYDLGEPKTPSKRRKHNAASTPSSKHKHTPHRTPSSANRRIVLKKPLTFTPLTTRFLSPTHTTASPFQVARSNLHVS